MGAGSPERAARPGKTLAERGTNVLAFQLRLFSALQLLAGVGYIVVAVFLQFPPGDPLTLGLWAIGCLAIVTSVFGLAGGCCRVRCCLGVYTVLATLATLGQAGFVLYLFIAPDKAEAQISDYQRTQKGSIKENLHTIINIGRWVLLGLLGAQVLAIGVAAALRCCGRNRSYEEFQDDESAQYEARRSAASHHLEALRGKLGLQAALAAGEPGVAGSKRVINISAVSGSAAERQQQQRQQQHTMRSVLFQRSSEEDGKLEADVEAGNSGKITSRVATDAEPAISSSNPWDAQQPSPGNAWSQGTAPSPTRTPRFKAGWARASRN